MKTLNQVLLLLCAVWVLTGCIDPDQGGQGNKLKGSTANLLLN